MRKNQPPEDVPETAPSSPAPSDAGPTIDEKITPFLDDIARADSRRGAERVAEMSGVPLIELRAWVLANQDLVIERGLALGMNLKRLDFDAPAWAGVDEKLAPFADLIAAGEVPHERIAEMAGVTLEEFNDFLNPASAPAEGDSAIALGDGETAEPKPRPPPITPRAVIVTAPGHRRIDGIGTLPVTISLGDVYTGEMAEHLWRGFRSFVDEYTP